MQHSRQIYMYSVHWLVIKSKKYPPKNPIGIGIISILYTTPLTRQSTLNFSSGLRVDAMSLAVSAGIDINYCRYSYTMSIFEYAVFHSAKVSDISIVNFLLQVCSPNLDRYGYPLRTAATHKNFALFDVLVSAGASIPQAMRYDNTRDVQIALNKRNKWIALNKKNKKNKRKV